MQTKKVSTGVEK